MNKIKYLIGLSILIIFSACNPNRVYQEYESFNQSLWYKTDIKEFKVDLQESGNYNLGVTLRYIEGCPHKSLPIKINYTAPSGESQNIDHEFIIIDEDGYFQGEIAGSICDIEDILNNSIELSETGVYNFSIEHKLDRDPAMLIMEIGLILEKTSQE